MARIFLAKVLSTLRLRGQVESLTVGQASSFATDVPPLIKEVALRRLEALISRARDEGHLVAQGGSYPSEMGWFCLPTLAVGISLSSPLLRKEAFGPLLTVEGASSMEVAMARVEELPFALTGGIFSRSPQILSEAKSCLPVGNLYINRAITGARVGRQPFGGGRLSGTGAKAGGYSYLHHFVEERVSCEDVKRHGLSL